LRLDWTGIRDAVLDTDVNSFSVGARCPLTPHLTLGASVGISESRYGSVDFGGLTFGVSLLALAASFFLLTRFLLQPMEAIMNDRIKSGLMVVGILIACAGAIAQVPSPNAGIARGSVGATLSGNGNAIAGGQVPRPDVQGTLRSQSDATAEATRRAES